MTWRKIRSEDIQRGVLIRFGNMTDTPFNGAVIIGVDTYGAIMRIARPYAYATEHYNNKQPLMGCEVFDVSITANTDIEVYEGRDGELRSMLT